MKWIALSGYMGAGKTVVGRRVAARLDLPFIDADRAIEEHAGMAIPEIFDKRGEVWFRRTEEDVIREILSGDPKGVLALGGGALLSTKTRGLLARTAWLAWLRVTPETAWQRVEGSDRPLAVSRDRFLARAAQREEIYRDSADLEIASDDPPDEVAGRVVAWVQTRATDSV